MKFKQTTERRFNQIVTNLPDSTFTLLFENFCKEEIFRPSQRWPCVRNSIKSEMKQADFNNIWRKIELAELFTNWISVNQLEIAKHTITSIRQKLKSKFLQVTHYSILEISKSPKIIMIALLSDPKRGLMEKAGLSFSARDTFYLVPKFKLLLSHSFDDSKGKEHLNFVHNELFGKSTPFRVKSLINTKFFNEVQPIKRLNVNAEFQITGFAGLDQIMFEGDDVKLGLYGLHKRQDIRVHLDQVGPNMEVASENLHLKIGPRIKIKNFKGFEELKTLL